MVVSITVLGEYLILGFTGGEDGDREGEVAYGGGEGGGGGGGG